MTDMFSIGFKTDTKGLEKADKALDDMAKSADVADENIKDLNKDLERTGKASNAAAKGADKLAKSSKKVSSGFQVQKNAAQNLGFQLQDAIVQAEMGTSAFTILAQQAPQAAQSLGPAGALFGAAIALGAVVGGVLFKAFVSVADSSEELKEKINELSESFHDLSEAEKVFLAKEAGKTLDDKRTQYSDLTDELTEMEKELVRLVALEKDFRENAPKETFFIEQQLRNIKDAENSIIDMKAQLELLRKEESLSVDSLSEFSGETEVLTEEQEKNRKAIDSTIESLLFQAKTIGMTTREISILTAEKREANEIDLEAINASYDLIDAYEAEQAAIKKNQKALQDKNKERKIQLDLDKRLAEQEERKQQTIIDAQLKSFDDQISKLKDGNLSKVELENEYYRRSLELLDLYGNERVFLKNTRQEIEFLLESDHQAKLLKLQEESDKKRIEGVKKSVGDIDNVVSIFGDLQGIATQKRKRQLDEDLRNSKNFTEAEIANKEKQARGIFEAQKNADLASIVSSTAVGVMGQLAQGNFIGAAAIGASGALNFAKASSNSYSSPASLSTAGVTPPPSVSNTTNNTGGNIINLNVSNNGGGQIDAESIQEYFKDGGILFDQDSEQAGILR